MKKQLAATIGIAAAALLTPPAHAVTTTILQPISVTSNVEEVNFAPIQNIINQSGLLENYTSGISNFSQFTKNVRHTRGIGKNFGGLTGSMGTLTFTLSEEQDVVPTIQGMAIWNLTLPDQGLGINKFELYADMNANINNDETFLTQGSVSVDDLTPNNKTDGTHARTFNFDPTPARFVHLQIISNHGNPNIVAAEEIAFEQSAPVPFEFGPIPGIIFILTVGGMNYFRKKGDGKDK